MNVAVYCSAAKELPQQWIDDATALGSWIGEHDCTLVYGGVGAGLMNVTAEAVKSAGGRVLGVVPEGRFGMQSDFNDESILVADLHERKQKMESLSNVFVALPGGCGTLDELIGTFSNLNFSKIDKVAIVYNSEGIFEPFIAQLRLFESRGLMKSDAFDKLRVANTIEELLSLLDENLKLTKK